MTRNGRSAADGHPNRRHFDFHLSARVGGNGRRAEERVQRQLAAFLAAAVVGYSRLVEGSEAGTVALLKFLQTEMIQPMIAKDVGRMVKIMGDGVLVEFGSAVDAV